MSSPLRVFNAFLIGLCLSGVAMASGGKAESAASRDGLWRQVDEGGIARRGERRIVPQAYRSLALDRARLQSRLVEAPMETRRGAAASPLLVSLPMPDGSFADFRVVESPIMAPELAAKFPDIRTYLGQGVDDPTATLRFDVSPAGLRAQILSARGTVYIDPYQGGDREHHISYARRDHRREREPMKCLVEHDPNDLVSHALERSASQAGGSIAAVSSGGTLRTYRLAMAATAEYTATNGGSVAGGMAGIVSTMNRVNGIYEREVGVRMVLVANNDLLVFTNAATDPYANSSGDLAANQTTIDAVIGTANYDIGHLVGTGGGGVASLRSPCSSSSKARGLTGSSAPTGDAYDVDFVAHEMGHQFGGNHTFNGSQGACTGGNRNSTTAYEPGSGITIQAYAGICGSDDLQPNSEDYFHRVSLDEIITFTTTGTGTCSVNTATGNTPPTITAPAASTIPAQTPFALTASGSDADGDALTFVWEQYDLGNTLAGGSLSDNGASPIFRGYAPDSSPTREFPSLRFQLANANAVPTTSPMPGTSSPSFLSGEILPTTSRTMTFRVTARDNRAGGGGSNDAQTTVTTVSTAGPFAVTAPNTALTWAAGSAQTVTWNVAGTTDAPISTANVRIKLSTDGGQTYPITLVESTANNGSANITVPANTPASLQARVRVEAVGNIYFDISDANFTITSAGNVAPTISVTGSVTTRQGSPTATATVATVADANGNPISVSVTGAPTELTVTAANVSGSIQMSATAGCSLVAPTATSTSSGSKVYPVTLIATNSLGAKATATVNINVGGNLRPTLGTYADKLTFPSIASTVTPSAVPSDGNGNLVGTSISPTTLPGGGTVSLNGGTGVVSINTTAGTTFGTYPIAISATDTCGGVRTASFNLTVATPDPLLSQTARQVTSDNNLIEPNECNTLDLTVANNGGSSATGVSSTLSTSTPGVTIAQANSAYPDIASTASATNSTAFQISTDSSVQCGSTISLTQAVSYGQNGSPASFNFTLPVGQPATGAYEFSSGTGAAIPAGGVLVSGSNTDDAIVDIVVPTGFDFSVYSTNVTGGSTLRVSTNGNLQITASGGSRQWSNAALPSTGSLASATFPASAPTLLPYWDDLVLDLPDSGIFSQLVGTAPNRQWIVEWRGHVFNDGAVAVNTQFAIVFNEGSNQVQYRYVLTGAGGSANGAGATIGLQSASSGGLSTQFSLNTASISAGTVLTAVQPPGVCSPGPGVCGVAPTPTLSVGDATVTEGNAGARLASFTVSLSSAAPSGGVSFDITTSSADSGGSSARADSDYAHTSRSLSIAAGQSSTSFDVKVFGDTRQEPDEFFQVRASNVNGATLGNDTGLGTITNDDSASLLSVGSGATPPLRTIASVQGTGLVSPLSGQRLRVAGIVTALHRDGFHLQSTHGDDDNDPASAEGLFVHTGAQPALLRGDRVEVLGQVQEAAGPGRLSLSQTRIAAEDTRLLERGLPLPAPVNLTPVLGTRLSTTALERYEGMRASLPSLRVVAPVSGRVDERDASSAADGRFYGVPQGLPRPFREPGLHALETPLQRSGEVAATFDGNPERLQVDTLAQSGSRALAVDAGDSVSGLVGVLAQGQGAYALLADPSTSLQVRSGSQPRPVTPAASGEITVARLDARRLFDDQDDAQASEPVLHPDAYALRLAKTANAVCSHLRNPAVLAMAEVENAKVLADLAAAANSRAGNVLFPGACSDPALYRAHMAKPLGRGYKQANGDSGRLGFLVDNSPVRAGLPRVQVVSLQEADGSELFVNADGSREPLFDAAPQILRVRINRADGRHEALTVMQVQLRSQQGLDDDAPGRQGWASVADYVQAKRLAQARSIARLVQARQVVDRRERIVLLGGFEASEFSDGRDDLMAVVAGTNGQGHAAASPLANMTLRLPANERYSTTQEGNAVALDHVLVNPALLDGRYALRTEYARTDADFGEDNAGDFAVPLRASDRDAAVLYIGQP